MEKNNLLNSLYEKADKMREAKIRELRVTSNAENLAYGSNSKRLRDALEDITTIRDACIEVNSQYPCITPCPRILQEDAVENLISQRDEHLRLILD